jgi:hypothetical protein
VASAACRHRSPRSGGSSIVTASGLKKTRSAAALVQEALADWEERQAERHAPTRPPHTPVEAAARTRELRKGNILPAGATIKGLIDHGRA